MDDKNLKNEFIERPEVNPYKEGLYILGLVEGVIETISNRIRDLYEYIKKNKKKEINRNPNTMLKGAIFAIGTRKYNNPEWMEHCSSSLREIFHVWRDRKLNGLEDDLRKFFVNKTINSVDVKIIWHYYEFFSGIDHHEPDKWKGALSAIEKKQYKHTDGLSEDEFIKQTKAFFELLEKILLL